MSYDSDAVAQVRDLLAHLHDYGYCQDHPLTERVPGSDVTRPERMRRLRHLVIESIETLRPRPGTPATAPAVRTYQVLRMHYVEGRLAKEIADQLSVSTRQIYRYLRKAEVDLTTQLEARLTPSATFVDAEQAPSSATLLQQETSRLSLDVETVALAGLIEGAVGSVGRLAQGQGVTLHWRCEPPGLDVLANPQLLRHLLVNALSDALQRAVAGSHVQLLAIKVPGGARLELAQQVPPGANVNLPPDVKQLAHTLGACCYTQAEGSRFVTGFLLTTQPRRLLLVIDDNEGMIELVRRYLTDSDYTVCGATSGEEGLAAALHAPPDVILLDVLLARQDGWEVLQRLQAEPATQAVPVIICSVFNNPGLAHSLGASAFLTKPLRRPQLLETLATLAAPPGDTRHERPAAAP